LEKQVESGGRKERRWRTLKIPSYLYNMVSYLAKALGRRKYEIVEISVLFFVAKTVRRIRLENIDKDFEMCTEDVNGKKYLNVECLLHNILWHEKERLQYFVDMMERIL